MASSADVLDLAERVARVVIATTRAEGIAVHDAVVRRGPRVLVVALRIVEPRQLSRALAMGDAIGLAVGAGAVRVARSGSTVEVEIPLPSALCASIPLSKIATHGHRTAIGASVDGVPVVIDLDDAAHVLVVGETDCGKSVALQAMICGLVWGAPVETTRLLMIDGKARGLAPFARLANLVHPIVESASEALAVVDWLMVEVDERRRDASRCDARLVVVVDEVTELLMESGGVDGPIGQALARVARLGRELRVHAWLATQHPRADMMARVASVNARRLVGSCGDVSAGRLADGDRNVGAHLLRGRGDFIWLGGPRPVRLQVSKPTDDELLALPVVDVVERLDLPDRPDDFQRAPHASQQPKPVAAREVAWVLARFDEDGRLPGINATQEAIGAMDDPPTTRCGDARARRVLAFVESMIESRASWVSRDVAPPIPFDPVRRSGGGMSTP